MCSRVLKQLKDMHQRIQNGSSKILDLHITVTVDTYLDSESYDGTFIILETNL